MHLALIAIVSASLSAPNSDELIAPGSAWNYLDDGSDQGSAWSAPGFDDSLWVSGNAQLGYGDGDETTVVSFGPDSNDKHITTYFRRSFSVSDPLIYQSLDLNLQRDDGAVVYLNGAEIARSNLPVGVINSETLASGTIASTAEDVFVAFSLDASALVAGNNVLAVEIHQRSATSSDLSFDLELHGETDIVVSRGPYLQLGTATGMVVRWRTNTPTDSVVHYGTDSANLDQVVTLSGSRLDHEVELVGLQPEVTYFYDVGTSTEALSAGSDHFFETAPTPGSARPTRLWVLGDSGTANANAAAVRDSYYSFTGTDHTNLWLMLGDNAYNLGLDEEYQAAVFDTYPEMLRKSSLWPTRGNHETDVNAYFDAFTLPNAGQAGGVSSGSEAYYSFDYANIHFICLDSEGSDRSVGGSMYLWLQSDLSSTLQDWIIAYWHHPPYTKGSHDSDTELKLIEMRTNILPLLEAGGVDLVLNGHSHSYERSVLIDGHYGLSSTFDNTMIVDAGDGKLDGTGAYQKAPDPNAGAVYCVMGTSGKTSGGALNHPVMYHSVSVLGSVVLDFDDQELNVTFLKSTGEIDDHFTLQKIDFDCGFSASATLRNAGTNPSSLIGTAPIIGQLLTLDLDVGSTGHALGGVFAYQSPATIPLSGGATLLVNLADPGGELLGFPLQAGPNASFSRQVPIDPTLCGFTFSAQAVHFFGFPTYLLSNAQDFVVGF